MTPVHVVQPIAGDLPEPKLERQHRIAQVIGQPPAGLQQDGLDHITCILPASQRPIKPHGDHPPQWLAMASKQPIDGRCVIPRRVFQHSLCFDCVRPHLSAPSFSRITPLFIIKKPTTRNRAKQRVITQPLMTCLIDGLEDSAVRRGWELLRYVLPTQVTLPEVSELSVSLPCGKLRSTIISSSEAICANV